MVLSDVFISSEINNCYGCLAFLSISFFMPVCKTHFHGSQVIIKTKPEVDHVPYLYFLSVPKSRKT